MVAKFMGKNPHRKLVRQIPNRKVTHTVPTVKKVETADEKTIENNIDKTNKDMSDDRLQKIEEIAGMKAPKRRVKVEKKDKGLIERTENSTILLTEDNKMVLND